MLVDLVKSSALKSLLNVDIEGMGHCKCVACDVHIV
jgi:hypothetical protein